MTHSRCPVLLYPVSKGVEKGRNVQGFNRVTTHTLMRTGTHFAYFHWANNTFSEATAVLLGHRLVVTRSTLPVGIHCMQVAALR